MHITVSAMLPYDDAEQARSALCARLQEIIERRRLPAAALDGARMQVAGPTVVTDPAGHRWYEWVARLKIRPVLPARHE